MDHAHRLGRADNFVAFAGQMLRDYLKWHVSYRGVNL
jgi:hypothetical protein